MRRRAAIAELNRRAEELSNRRHYFKALGVDEKILELLDARCAGLDEAIEVLEGRP